jgi:hypothetical protein
VINPPIGGIIGGPCSEPTPAMVQAIATSLATYLAQREGAAVDCSLTGLPDRAEDAAQSVINNEFQVGQFQDFFLDICNDLDFDDFTRFNAGVDEVGFFDVTCYEAGEFEISVHDVFEADNAIQLEVICGGDVETGTITAVPTTVETNPSIANVAHSLVWVNLLDDQDEASSAGTKVTFMTDRCAVESSAVDTEEEFVAQRSIFNALNPLSPATAAAVESSAAATTAPDGASRQQDEVNSFNVTGPASTDFAVSTVAATVLHCDPIHAPNVTPGPAVVTAIVVRGQLDNQQVADNDDLVLKTTVTVIGPPAANGLTVTASPATLACGEKATLDITVKDAIGQNVSDHTFVELVTNAGGVLAGTGAVAGQAVSSRGTNNGDCGPEDQVVVVGNLAVVQHAADDDRRDNCRARGDVGSVDRVAVQDCGRNRAYRKVRGSRAGHVEGVNFILLAASAVRSRGGGSARLGCESSRRAERVDSVEESARGNEFSFGVNSTGLN